MNDLVFEIGTEELPASAIRPAAEALGERFREFAEAQRLSFGAIETHGSPRRLALLVRGLAAKADDVDELLEGPATSVAFKDGVPTKAAEGFARKAGVAVERLERMQTAQGERLVARRHVEGEATAVLLQTALPAFIGAIPFRKSMRWGAESATFARPVRWLGAVYGREVVSFSWADVQSGGVTYGHRFLAPGAIALTDCDAYVPALRDAKVLVRWDERRERVIAAIDQAAEEAGGRRVEDDELVDTITGLVEWPSGVAGAFAPEALDMPREVLVSEMREHQKYASVESADGKLLAKFVAVANTPVKDVAVSRRGYERVLAARLSDARFFFDDDLRTPLHARVAALGRVTFQESLGSVLDKVGRVTQLAAHIAQAVGYADAAKVERTALLSKADLTTGMVGEFPELQGVMGREYARHDGEAEDVALGVFEHYLPRGASDSLPTGDLGAFVGLADRVDTIVGIFAIGRAPTGTQDAFGLRRACLGVLRVLEGRGYRLSLSALIGLALDLHYSSFEARGLLAPPAGDAGDKKRKKTFLTREEAAEHVVEFFRGRLKSDLAQSIPADLAEAVLTAGYDDVVDLGYRAKALGAIAGTPDYLPLAVAFGRASHIIEKQAKDLGAGDPDPALFTEDAERALHAEVERASAEVRATLRTGDYPEALRALAALRPFVDRFFDGVLVMAEDEKVRTNRLRLVRSVQGLFEPIADFSRIQTR